MSDDELPELPPRDADDEYLIIGGRRHGDTTTLLPGTNQYVDLVSGETFILRCLYDVKISPLTGQPTETYGRFVLLLAQIAADPVIVHQALGQLLTRAWVREGGQQVAIPSHAPTISPN